ncbi:hypothetical protein QUF80_01650 [Desulfococcaceae bacterium HSG8]|nr:hypothetical protein [Desulfococcaceae bacterium HSG8]
MSIPREQQLLGTALSCSVRIDKSEPAAEDLSIPREQQTGILSLNSEQ